MRKIVPFIWFSNNAEEAIKFYTSVFKNSRIKDITLIDEKIPGHKGTVSTITFELEGQEFIALNGGPGVFDPSGFISLFVACKDQKEVDYYWEKLTEGGDENAQQCGWLKDKYGVTWQIVPEALGRLLADPNRGKAKRVTEAMLKMKKIDVAALEKAYG